MKIDRRMRRVAAKENPLLWKQINSGVTLNGRALARNGAVTLIDDTINVPTSGLANRESPNVQAFAASQYASAVRGEYPGGEVSSRFAGPARPGR